MNATASFLSLKHSLVKGPEEAQGLVDTTSVEEEESSEFPSAIAWRRGDRRWRVLRRQSRQQSRRCVLLLKQRDKIGSEAGESSSRIGFSFASRGIALLLLLGSAV